MSITGKAARDECVALLGRIVAYVLASVPSLADSGQSGAQVRYDAGRLLATAAQQVQNSSIGDALADMFDHARLAGATLASMSYVRSQIATLTALSDQAAMLIDTAVILALASEAAIIAELTFSARDQVETLLAQMQSEFADAEEAAADRGDSSVYQAVIALRAAVTRHLVVTAQPLPLVVHYAIGTALPSLALAQLLYADGSRADELRDENHVIHPAFMPAQGVALSS